MARENIDPPWDDLKVAFSVKDGDLVWSHSTDIDPLLPEGWSLIAMDGTGSRYVIVFRVEGIPTEADGKEVKAILNDFDRR